MACSSSAPLRMGSPTLLCLLRCEGYSSRRHCRASQRFHVTACISESRIETVCTTFDNFVRRTHEKGRNMGNVFAWVWCKANEECNVPGCARYFPFQLHVQPCPEHNECCERYGDRRDRRDCRRRRRSGHQQRNRRRLFGNQRQPRRLPCHAASAWHLHHEHHQDWISDTEYPTLQTRR